MIFTKTNRHIQLFLFFSFFILKNSFALETLSYSGRLVQASGAPVSGTVKIRAELAYTNNTGNVLCTEDIPGVVLSKGVFHVKIDFDCSLSGKTLTQVLSQTPVGHSVAIQITDITDPDSSKHKAYSFQALHALPFATVASQLVQMGAGDGQFLKWNNTNKQWEPGSVTGATGGTVTNVTASSPISISNGTSTPDISIAQASASSDGYLSSVDWNTFNSKQGSIAAGTNLQYYRGDKTWQTLNSDVVPEGSTNLYFQNARVLGLALTGFAPAAGAIVATDTVVQGFSKTQGQINSINSAAGNYLIKNNTDTITGTVNVGGTGFLTITNGPSILTDATNKQYVDNSISTANNLKVSKAGDTMSGVLTLDNDLKIKGGSNYVTVKGHATSGNYNLFLPQTAGTAGYVLSTDGSGNTSWINPSATATGTGTVNSASITDGSIVDADINSSAAIAQSKIANLTTDLSNKEPTITAGTATQYWKGNKTWSSLQTDVQALVMNNYTVGANASLANTDSLSDAFGKVQGQINATNTAVAGKEPSLTAGTTSQFYRGDKSWQTLNGSAVANTAAGNITATNVQSALNELDTEKQANITSSSVITSGSVTTSLQNGVNINPFGAAVGNTGELRFYELTANGTNFTSLKAPDALTANINYVMPGVAPSAGQVLSSDASGVMSWISIPSAPVASTFGRTGAVVATAGDYNAGLITNSAAGSIAATTVQAALNELDAEKQPLITAGTTAQYYRGDKTFVDFGTDVRATLLTGYSVGSNTALAVGDSTLAAFGKVQGQINATNTAVSGKEPAITSGTTAQYIRGDKTLSTFATDAINSVLSTFALNAGAKPTVATSDSVVGAFGKVQKYLNDINSDYVSKTANQTINGTLAINSATGFITVPTPINPNDAVNKAYVDGFGQWLENGANIYFNTGNVGIGNTNPATNLQVSGTEATVFDETQVTGQAVGQGTQVRIENLSTTVNSFSGITLINRAGNVGIARIAAINRGADNTDLAFVTENSSPSEKMRILGNGYVGIGTTTPDSPLQVVGDTVIGERYPASTGTLPGGGNKLLFSGGPSGATFNSDNSDYIYIQRWNEASDDTELRFSIGDNKDPNDKFVFGTDVTGVFTPAMAVLTSGNVGIGTTTPSDVLEVVSGTSRGITSTRYASNGGAVQVRGARGTISAPTATQSGDYLGWFFGEGYNGTAFGGSGIPGAMNLVATENWTTSANGTAVSFTTIPNGAVNGSEKMRIDHNGNVGIATSNPQFKLHIGGSSAGGADQTVAQIGDVVGTGSGPLYLTYNAPMISGNTYFNTAWKYAGGNTKPSTIGISNGISFQTSNNAVGVAGANVTDMTTKMYINTNGEIGIGTNSTLVPLTIDGTTTGAGTTSPIVAMSSTTNDAFSVLPWTNETYLGTGVYYKNGVWVHKGSGATSALFSISGVNGGRWWASNNSSASFNVAGAVSLWTAGGVLQGASSRTWKENFTELKKPLILQKINRLNISRWNYKTEGEGITHIGPIAEEWAREFNTGEDNKHIALIDEAGVALAGIQGLSQEQDQIRKEHNSSLQWIKNTFNKVFVWLQGHEDELALQKREIASLKAENAKLKKESEATKARLDKIEKALNSK